MNNNKPHSFHIPVMGLAFTIDSPIKIAKYGISSAISLADDFLIERMNKYYSNLFKIPYQEITTKIEDYRAKRITSYLNTVDKITKETFESLKNSFKDKKNELEKYIDMLPEFSKLKKNFQQELNQSSTSINKWINQNLKIGSIDVNIMTKLDKKNYSKGAELPIIFNDAHAALRGFAQSNLNSSVILSAGMNPRLYSYFEEFEDFFPNQDNILKKRIILKVSDYRSALIQGKFLAKKGLWVSEYRIESGLNCGGHAFATDGYLLGPILEEFKKNKDILINNVFSLYVNSLKNKNKYAPNKPPAIEYTVQGGVGNAKEHNFLLNNYQLSSIGWGSPFLLVPEVTTVDKSTVELLKKATEKELYLSNISPLGVPFNSVKGNSNDQYRNERIKNNKSGSSCPKKFLVLNTEFTKKAACTGSLKYQKKRIDLLKKENLSTTEYQNEFFKITEKTCLCEGLANSALINYNIEKKAEKQGVAICPGPNLAYFDKEVSLNKMIKHIYGEVDILTSIERPHMFIKELKMYIEYFTNKMIEFSTNTTNKQQKYLTNFQTNLNNGIEYYKNLFTNLTCDDKSLKQLTALEIELKNSTINLS